MFALVLTEAIKDALKMTSGRARPIMQQPAQSATIHLPIRPHDEYNVVGTAPVAQELKSSAARPGKWLCL